MRIAYISYEFPPDTGKGGIGTYVAQVAKAMAACGNEIYVFAGSPYGEDAEFLNGYHVHRVLCENVNDFREKVVEIFAVQNAVTPFDLIESPEINGNAWEIKKKSPIIPLVVRLHAPNQLVEGLKKNYLPFTAKLRYVLGAVKRLKFDLGYWRPYDKNTDPDYQFLQLANHITAPSQAMKDWAVTNWQIDEDRIEVIPNIFSPSEGLLNIPVIERVKYHRIVFWGRLNVLKGLVNATKAIKKILIKNPGWLFRVIGDDGPGPNNNITMRAWMKHQLAAFGNRVEYIDGMAYENLPAAISECEIVLLPSLFESFSYTCAEAMAAGKAVIGSSNAGMADLIRNEISGLLVNPYSHKEITAALTKLILDNEFRYELSVQARKDILAKQNASDTALLYQRYYHSIMQKGFAKN